MSSYFNNHPILTSLLLLAFLYVVVLVVMYKGQRKLLYHPDSTRPHPAEYALGQGTEIVHVPSHDGIPLYSWYRRPQDKDKPLVILFHGNAGHIGDRADRLRFFRDQGYGFLIPSYRYNAGHGGIPGEEQLIRDGQAVLNWLRSKGHDDDQFVLYGESLGSGVAISLAQNNVGRAVILEGPYSSVTDVAAEVYWFLPVRALIKDEFDSKSYIGNLIPPVLILHGARDKTIPVKFAQKLHSHGNPHKDRIIIYPDGEHTGLYAHGADRDVAAFLSVISIGN